MSTYRVEHYVNGMLDSKYDITCDVKEVGMHAAPKHDVLVTRHGRWAVFTWARDTGGVIRYKKGRRTWLREILKSPYRPTLQQL